MSKLIVLSVDALFDEDMAYLRTLPNFGKLMKKAAYSKDGMRSVYPSLTYPCHASIMTGTMPDKHGIFHNEKLDPGNPTPPWYWYHEALKVETCLAAAKRAGLSTACIGWPVMGAAPEVDYLVPEIWPDGWDEDPRPIFETAASKDAETWAIIDRHLHKLRRTRQPFMDHVMIGCACDILRLHKPDIMFIHGAHLDHARHANGIQGPMIQQAIHDYDDWLGRLMEATMDAGTYEETNFCVTSDHGHLPVTKMLNPNVYLAEAGLIEVGENGELKDWQAFCNSTALSSQVVMKDPADDVVRAKLEKVLYALRNDLTSGVEAVFTKRELAEEMHVTGDFEYMLEGRERTSFGNAWTGPKVVTPDNTDYKFSITSHGHLPHKGPQPVFMIAGPDVKEGAVTERRHIIDEAPTFAALLHFDMPQATGKAMLELLK